MFDRLYKLKIRHSSLPGKDSVIVLTGDSSKPSLGVDFSCSVNMSDVASEGTITVTGLSDEHIQLLSAIRRYNYPKNAVEKNFATLFVGWRDCSTGAVSPMTAIIHGAIIEAIPGQLPKRSLTMTIFRHSLNDIKLEDDERTVKKEFDMVESQRVPNKAGVPMKAWLDACASDLMSKYQEQKAKKAERDLNSFEIRIDSPFAGWMIPDMAHPQSVEEFKKLASSYGCNVYDTEVSCKVSAGEQAETAETTDYITTILYVTEGWNVQGSPLLVSEATGMIGLPRSIPMGASVDVVLKDPINPGTIVNLQSNVFKKLSSDPSVYTNGGLYRVMSTRFVGSFLGDQWMQTLTLNRGGSILK